MGLIIRGYGHCRPGRMPDFVHELGQGDEALKKMAANGRHFRKSYPKELGENFTLAEEISNFYSSIVEAV